LIFHFFFRKNQQKAFWLKWNFTSLTLGTEVKSIFVEKIFILKVKNRTKSTKNLFYLSPSFFFFSYFFTLNGSFFFCFQAKIKHWKFPYKPLFCRTRREKSFFFVFKCWTKLVRPKFRVVSKHKKIKKRKKLKKSWVW